MRYLVLATLILFLGGCASLERLAIPNSDLLDEEHQVFGVANDVDHEEWGGFLETYTFLDELGVVRVAYSEVTDADHNQLKNYIELLSNADSSKLSKNSQLAYWVNLYNAKTVDIILDHYPVASIRNIKDGIFDLGPWEDKRLIVNGESLSLHDIEHGIVRPVWSAEPRIHYLLNCAATGCPNLGRKAYTAENVEGAMAQAAREYVNNMRGVSVMEDGRIYVSKIYSWYLEDFGGSEASVLRHLREYANADLKKYLQNADGIGGYFYDWSLNEGMDPNKRLTADGLVTGSDMRD
ncbi:DUF547 domain-containing protein [Sneathiella marina]|uniref:DUF547 domain-containing protein n=1 Tax=Sneathiella marina TaxID=2950108 RepID=A0ABY4VZK7_9PROT|nr:DUF547 domain-containing protein [Sneathiella marina]USG60372.1 DUF547 domain-containing protein [Sneathiella marina]